MKIEALKLQPPLFIPAGAIDRWIAGTAALLDMQRDLLRRGPLDVALYTELQRRLRSRRAGDDPSVWARRYRLRDLSASEREERRRRAVEALRRAPPIVQDRTDGRVD